MTMQDLADLMVRDKTNEKMVSTVVRDFKIDRARAEDLAQRAALSGLRKAHEFKDETGALAYLMEKVVYIAIDSINLDAARRAALAELPRYTPIKDPMRHIDYKIDLERAIRAVTSVQVLQAALWEIYFEHATWSEVLADMPKTKTPNAWEHKLRDVMPLFKAEMRRKGYKK